MASFNRLDDTRNRSSEFAERQVIPPATLLRKLSATMQDASEVLSRLSEADLMSTLNIQGYTVTGLHAVYHVVDHFGMHCAQILYITKLVRGEDLGFYRELDETGQV